MATQIDGQKISVKLKKRYEQFEFDKLQMYFGKPYVVDLEDALGQIVINMPTIGDVMTLGEKRFFATLNIFTTNTTSYRLLLWDNGLDWNVVTDFELFCMLYGQIDFEASKLMFGDLNFADFERVKKGEEICLYNRQLNIEINEKVYQHIAQYLRAVFNINPDEKLTTSQMMKEMFISKDRRELANMEEKKKNGEATESSMRSIISACVNHPGFKYKLTELIDVGVCEFYDSVKRLQIYEGSTAVLKGLYSGMVDGKKIKPEEYNFMRDI